MNLESTPGGICAAKGFRASGVSAGIKTSGGLDLAMVVSEVEASVAATFTTNLAAAAPVLLCRERLQKGSAKRGIVVNSGCANACTGQRGLSDALEMVTAAEDEAGLSQGSMMVCSTGLIGSFLPMGKVKLALPSLVGSLGLSDTTLAQAIMTTDTQPKRASFVHEQGWSIGGIAKGAGMIAPNMATMLSFITTDAKVEAGVFQQLLSQAVTFSFNAITIDGDTSTNDSVIALANGASAIAPDPSDLQRALDLVCKSLAEQIALDGEGTTKLVTVKVRGAKSAIDADRAARTVASSTLVKTALYGQDPNWGRIAAALGRSGADVDFEHLTIAIGGHEVLRSGIPGDAPVLALAREQMHGSRFDIDCDLAVGDDRKEIVTTDLSQEYVRLNSEYET